MAMIAMATPPQHSAFREYPYEPIRSAGYSRPREADSKAVALPSIRQAIPELQLSIPPTDARNKRPSPIHSASGHGPHSPDYVHSPTSKKRKLGGEEEQLRHKQIPRMYDSPDQPPSRHYSSPTQRPQTAISERTRTPPSHSYYASPRTLPAPGPVDTHRPSLPSLPAAVPYDRDHSNHHGQRDHDNRAPMGGPVRSEQQHYGRDAYSFSYRHSTPYQPLSPGARPYERTPFSSGYSAHYESGRYGGELGVIGMGNDSKQRKRRGNLPKETTDKLRAWFVAHLTHPYPTEDEKQDLMRQTGLQMNQISNWFINARRRQLPAMMNNAQAETNAMSRGASSHSALEGKPHPLSDGEADGYDDGRGIMSQRPSVSYKRESV